MAQLRNEAERGRKWIVTCVALAIATCVAGALQLSMTDSDWWGFPLLLAAYAVFLLSLLISMGVEIRQRRQRIALFEARYGADAGK